MKQSTLLFFLLCSATILPAQDVIHSSTLTVSAGGQTYSYNYFDEHGGPAFAGRYEFRVWKYFAFETGVDNLWPQTHTGLEVIPSGQNLVSVSSNCSSCLIIPVPERTRVTLLPFGGKAILPLASGRAELFLGFGGAYAWNQNYGSSRDALLAQGSFGGRFALDRKRHFWLGTSLRGYSTGYSNYGVNRQSWISWTADFGYRFGH